MRVAVQQVRGNVTTTGNAQIVLKPNRRQFVQATIDSVSDRVFADSYFILSAKNSYDPDGQAKDMTYEWRCVRMKRKPISQDASLPQWTQCDALAAAVFKQRGAILTADLSTLANAYYEIEVKVVASASASASCYNSIRTGSDRVTFEVVSAGVPVVTAVRCSSLADCSCDGTVTKASRQIYVNAGESFILGAGCTDLDPQYTLKWDVLPTKSDIVDKIKDISKPKFLSPATARLVQVVVPHLAQREYTFRTSVLDEKNRRVNSATITLPINMPPTQGYVQVTPRKGVAMKTSFKIFARQWRDPESEQQADNLPLRYRFEVRDANTRANAMKLSYDFSSSSSLTEYIPLVTATKRTEAIQGEVIVVVYVRDYLGAVSSCDYTKLASSSEKPCPSVLIRLPSVPSTLAALSNELQNLASQQEGRAVTQLFTELTLHSKAALLNEFESRSNVTQTTALHDTIPVRRNIIAQTNKLVSRRKAVSGVLANSNNVQAIVRKAIDSPTAFDVVSDALSVSNVLIRQLPNNVEITRATRSFAQRSFGIYDRAATLLVREADAASATTTTTTTTKSPTSDKRASKGVREKLLDSMGAMCTSLTSGAIDDHSPIFSSNTAFSAACQKTSPRRKRERASSGANGRDATSSYMVLDTANDSKNGPPLIFAGMSKAPTSVLVLQSRYRSLVLADSGHHKAQRPRKRALSDDQSTPEQSHVTQVQILAPESDFEDVRLDLQIPVVLASHLKEISRDLANDVVRSRVGAMEAGGTGNLFRTALTRVFVDKAHQLSAYYIMSVSQSLAQLPETRRFSYPLSSFVKTNPLSVAMTTMINPAQTLVPYNQPDLTFKQADRFLSQPHAMIFIAAFVVAFLGLLIFDLIFMYRNYGALVDVQRELYLSTGSLDPLNHLLEARDLKAELPSSKRACCAKLHHAMLVHHPAVSMVLSTAPCKCCWNRRSFLLLQTRFSAQAQLSMFFLHIFTLMLVEGLFVQNTDIKEDCIFLCSEWEVCCEPSADLFSLRGLFRRVVVCIMSQILCIPALTIVPLLFTWRVTSAESETRPIKRKQLPMASFAYLFETQDDAIYLPTHVEEGVESSVVEMQSSPEDISKVQPLPKPPIERLFRRSFKGPPSMRHIDVPTETEDNLQSSKITLQSSPKESAKSRPVSEERSSDASSRSRRANLQSQSSKVATQSLANQETAVQPVSPAARKGLSRRSFKGPPSIRPTDDPTETEDNLQLSNITLQSSPKASAKSRPVSEDHVLPRRSVAPSGSTRRAKFAQRVNTVIESNRDLDMVADTLQHIVSFKNQVRILRLLEWKARESPEVRPWRAVLGILSWMAVFIFCALPLFLCMSFSISMPLTQVCRMAV